MNEGELQRVYNCKIYPRDSLIKSIEGFVILDISDMEGSHWTCFILKDNKRFYFDSFGEQHNKFLINKLPKPISYHNYKRQDKNFNLSGFYCLYVFFLIEKLNYYDVILKMYFDTIIADKCIW